MRMKLSKKEEMDFYEYRVQTRDKINTDIAKK